jgi:DNA-binding NarL/FixJ family response regulator
MEESAKSPVAPSTNLHNTTFPNIDSIRTAQPHLASRSLRVLVADNYEAVRMGLCAMLRSRQIEVCGQAKNGEEAIEKSRQWSPDLIILDISMPVLGGIEAAQQIRVFLPDVPILFYSMHNTRELIGIAKSVGARGFVTKVPFPLLSES